MSVHYFVKLEQGRAANASGQVVEAVARALRLDDVERRERGRRAARLGRAACDHFDARHGPVLTSVVTTSGTAAAATGRFLVGANPVLTDPEDFRCYPLDIKRDYQLVNETSSEASIYWGRECMSHHFDLKPGASTGLFEYDSANSVIFVL